MRKKETVNEKSRIGAEMKQRTYLAIDLKSFYASVECRERGLDPLDTNLVVADESRTEKTICLAVTPSLKYYGVSGRARLFEVNQKVREVNVRRQRTAPGRRLEGSSTSFHALQKDPSLALDFLIAPPRMAYYIEYSTRIYKVYLKYVAPEDIVAYSIDEVFLDVTNYLHIYQLSPRELAKKIILDVFQTTGITATAGIGTNLFLAKAAMDIVAKHIPADANGVRIAALDEMKFRRELWSHRPLTDFWRVGRGTARNLEAQGMFTMGDVALCSEKNMDPCTRGLQSFRQLFCDLFAEFPLPIGNSGFPYKRVTICVGFYFCSVNEHRRSLKGDLSVLHQKLDHLIQQFLHCVGKVLFAKPGDRVVIRWTLPFQKIHEIHILSAGAFDLTCCVNSSAAAVKNDLE